MTRPDDTENLDWLDADLAALRETAPPSDAFLAKLTADALAAQPVRMARPSLWAQMRDAFGGWGGLSGLAAATVTGFVIGLSGVSQVDDTVASLLGTDIYSPDSVLAIAMELEDS